MNQREIPMTLTEEERRKLKEEIITLLEKKSVAEIEMALQQLDKKQNLKRNGSCSVIATE